MSNFIKTPPPRPLGASETLESLTHWKTNFRTYFKRDDGFKTFIKETSRWDPAQLHYGQQTETSGLKRSAAEMKEDLVDLLSTLAGFLPHSYLTKKLLNNTKNWVDVWNIIYDHYGVQVTQETFLDFEDCNKIAGETHRQFFERLLQHATQHLAPAGVKIENISTGDNAEQMSISLMNMVALQWLRKIDPTLIRIVKTEYSTELRENTQLAELVPRIATNVDSLLERYNSNSTNCNAINTQLEAAMVDMTINKISNVRSRPNNKTFGNFSKPKRGRGNEAFCPGCYYLGQQLGTTIHVKHFPADCPRRATTIKLLHTEDNNLFGGDSDPEESNSGDYTSSIFNTSKTSFQELNQNNYQCNSECFKMIKSVRPTEACEPANSLAQSSQSDISTAHEIYVSDQEQENHANPIMSVKPFLLSAVCRLQQHRDQNKQLVRKEKSPMIPITIKQASTVATIDEGSEINCLDKGFALQNDIKFVPTHCQAYAAGKQVMELAGQTIQDVIVHLQGINSMVTWNLGKAIIVSNLGVDVLVGEPGKVDNMIMTVPHKKHIKVRTDENKILTLPYCTASSKDKSCYSACRSSKSVTLYPGESLMYQLPYEMHSVQFVQVSPRRETHYQWFEPRNFKVLEGGSIQIPNNSNKPIHLAKHTHFADVRSCYVVQDVRKIYDLQPIDESHLIPHASCNKDNESYLKEISIDPDQQLSSTWKAKFVSLCEQYSDIITPRPGKYNGYFGRVDNSINFSTKPPPSIRAHLPKYSHDMLKILAEKMDNLEQWGVLRKPEDLGIVPEFVVPSMLTPKPESNEWRLVTDFTALNIHIKKLETVNPTITDAKEKLARFNYHVQLDLSNYFYQGGMGIEDIQYLATPHPFKGLRVYTCEPQGLKNASEHAYERLARIYGDLCENEQMTRMADGIFVLGDTLEQLYENFKEVLHRARLCGLTFKPSKIIVAPVNTTLFGWRKIGDGWRPTDHTISPLAAASFPTTVKQMRSWLGSFKQLSQSINNYAVLLAPLEDIVASRGSAERITWTKQLELAFNKAKDSLKSINTVFVPKPTDFLHTYSDFSARNEAVGGRLEIQRVDKNGSIQRLHGGDFSCRLSKHQRNWLPCEGEALATKMVLEHFAPYLRENRNKVTHHTDNMPVVHAWRRSKTGAYSSSARISAFLSGISALDIEIVHTPGKELHSSDFNSRHPISCTSESCQICSFAAGLTTVGDKTIPMVGSISVADIDQGKVSMPYTQRAAWLKIQRSDPTHQRLSWLIDTSQTPEKKKTKGENTKLKLLHNLYANGQLKKAPDGFITVSSTDKDRSESQAISIPSPMFPGLMQALHLKLNHPSKTQLQRISARYFYAPGNARIIDEVTTNCPVCTSLRQLPTEIFTESTQFVDTFGSHFSADVIRREAQKILLIREKLSQFTMTTLIESESADDLRDALVLSILEMMPASGATVQVDNATGFQKLQAESEFSGSLLNKLKIRIDLGRTFNRNKNPIAENAIKEFHKECLRHNPAGGPLTRIDLSTITKTMNERIRERGLSSKEMAFRRDQVSNDTKDTSDKSLGIEQNKKREKAHPIQPPTQDQQFTVGQNVMLKTGRSKLKGRELFKIINLYYKNEEPWATILKSENQLRAKEYQVKTAELLVVPGQLSNSLETPKENPITETSKILNEQENTDIIEPTTRTRRQAAKKADDLIKSMTAKRVLKLSSRKASEEVPHHGWDWDTFNQLVMDDTSSVARIRQPEEYTDLDHTDSPDLIWDDSPVQFELSGDSFQLPQHEKNLSADLDINISLTDLDTTDDDVFTPRNPTRRSKHLQRSYAFRRRRSKKDRYTMVNKTDSESSSPSDYPPVQGIRLDQCQDLNEALNPRIPLAPEAVQPHPSVQTLTHPLQAIQLDLQLTNDQPQQAAPYNTRRSRRTPLDYKVYNDSGMKVTHRSRQRTSPEDQRGERR